MEPVIFWNDIYRQQPNIWGYVPNNLVMFLAQKVEPGQMVLDLGCGIGRDCIYLGRAGVYALGVDFSDEAVHKAIQMSKDENIATVRFVCADYMLFVNECSPNQFNAVLSVNALNHAGHQISAILHRIQDLLKPNGYLCLSLFASDDEEWTGHQHIGQRIYVGPFGQIQLYTLEEIQLYLRGFDILKLEKVLYIDKPHLGAQHVHRNSFWKIIAQLPAEKLGILFGKPR